MVPWMGLISLAHTQVRSADVVFTHFTSTPQKAIRLGDECFVPIDELKAWDLDAVQSTDSVQIKFEGKSAVVPARTFNGKVSVPFVMVAKALGTNADWIPGTDSLLVTTPITQLVSFHNSIQFKSALGLKLKPFVLAGPDRLVVDFDGATLGDIKDRKFDAYSRAFQYRPNVVRLIIDTPFIPFLGAPTDPTSEADLKIVPSEADASTKLPTATTLSSGPPSDPLGLAMTVELDTPTQTSITVVLPKKLTITPEVRNPDPTTIEIVLPGEQSKIPDGFHPNSTSILAAATKPEGQNTVLSLLLTRPMGAMLSQDGTKLHIQLLKPDVGDGKLPGKVIVVDPGHGGEDRGAHVGTINEKDLTLAIGKLLAKKLTAEGATVILTRDSDVFVPLTTRAEIANNNHANFFISCHINATGDSRSETGGITFHHMGKGVSRLLGICIQHEIAKVSQIPNMGVWSDARIYRQGGFSVLRNTKMPGVLIEFGFINHPYDRKRMIQSDFQQAVASAVVNGIKVFLGNAKTN